jgi:hypothetical protein
VKKLIYFGCLLALLSCSKNEPTPQDPRECFKNNEGNIFVDNKTKNPFKVTVNGSDKGTVPANSHILVTVRYDKSIPIEVVQASGYVISPDKFSGKVDVDVCGETLFRFQ